VKATDFIQKKDIEPDTAEFGRDEKGRIYLINPNKKNQEVELGIVGVKDSKPKKK
jgi:hypothetical protein